MAQKRKTVIGDYVSPYDILSQTPENYSRDNYFLKELQEKVLADWDYRPNKANIEYEDQWGKQTFKPIDVVLQSVISEKGTAISGDTRNVVFKNIAEKRFKIGSRFKFAQDLDPNNEYKDIWLVVNKNFSKMTASSVVQRCNGTLKSTYIEDGVSKIHTEPVIQGMDLSTVSIFYNDTIVSPQSQLIILAQHNEFTANYFINQRFVVGYDRVYRIIAINKFYGNSTENPHNIGVMTIYLEITEQSAYDDMDKRLAYQMTPEVILSTDEQGGSYSIKFTSPNPIPTDLTSTEVQFCPVVVDNQGKEYPELLINTQVSLENLPNNVNQNIYVDFVNREGESEFTLKRKRIYLMGDLLISCSALNPATSEQFTTSIKLVMRKQE